MTCFALVIISLMVIRAQSCEDTAGGAEDPYGDGCEYYDSNEFECGQFDDFDFSSAEMCCACGGGTEPAQCLEDPGQPI